MTVPTFSNMCLASGKIIQHFSMRDFRPSCNPSLSDIPLPPPPLFMSFSPVLSSLAQFSCPPLVAPAHGRKFGSKYLVGHEVHFTCSQGYRLMGPGTRVCQDNGTWSGVSAVCKGGSKSVKLICIIINGTYWTDSGQNTVLFFLANHKI